MPKERQQRGKLLAYVVLHDEGGKAEIFGLPGHALSLFQRAAGVTYPEAEPALPDGCH